jgi:hypothetical protein
MKRPVGVTAGVVVAMLGSIIALIVAVGFVATLFLPVPPGGQTPGKLATFVMALTVASIGGIGVWTAVGLFRLRPWARTSIQVLALFVAIGSAFVLVILGMLGAPAHITRDTVNATRIAAGLMFGIPLALAVWMLVQFNTSATKAAFASNEDVEQAPRPLSITFIAWSNLLSVAAFLVGAVTGGSGFVLGFSLPSWIARIYCVALAAVSLYIGKGLLDLRDRARVIAIGWSVFTLLNALVVFVPSVRQRILGVQIPPPANPDTAFLPFSPDLFFDVVFGAVAIGAALTIWFLEHHRDVFLRTENSRFLTGLHAS